MKRPIYTVLVRIMHTRQECKIWTIHPVGFRRTEESNYGHREGKNRETTSGWIYIITRSGSLASSGNSNRSPVAEGLSITRTCRHDIVHPLREPFVPPILFLLDRYPSRKRLLNRFNVLGQNDQDREIVIEEHNWNSENRNSKLFHMSRHFNFTPTIRKEKFMEKLDTCRYPKNLGRVMLSIIKLDRIFPLEI